MEVISQARDTVGHALAHVLLTIRPEGLSFEEVARAVSRIDAGAGSWPADARDDGAFFSGGASDPSPFLQFRQVTVPGRPRRRGDPFRLQITRQRACCAGCPPSRDLPGNDNDPCSACPTGHTVARCPV